VLPYAKLRRCSSASVCDMRTERAIFISVASLSVITSTLVSAHENCLLLNSLQPISRWVWGSSTEKNVAPVCRDGVASSWSRYTRVDQLRSVRPALRFEPADHDPVEYVGSFDIREVAHTRNFFVPAARHETG